MRRKSDLIPEKKLSDSLQFKHGYNGMNCPICGIAQYWINDGKFIACSTGHYYQASDFVDGSCGKVMTKSEYEVATGVANPKSSPDSEDLKVTVQKEEKKVIPEDVVKESGDRSPQVEESGLNKSIITEGTNLGLGYDTLCYNPKASKGAIPVDPYDQIQETIFKIDPSAIHDRLLNYGTLADALDRAFDNSRDAFLLVINAKVALMKLESDIEVQTSDMRKQATKALDVEKQSGQRTKQVTNDDVIARMAAMYPDEFRAVEEKKTKAKGMLAYFEQLAGLVKERGKDIRTLVEVSRR